MNSLLKKMIAEGIGTFVLVFVACGVAMATADMIKDGRRTCFFQVTVKDNLGNLIAIANTTGMHV